MTSYIGRRHSTLPDITPQRQRPKITLEESEVSNTHTSSLLGEKNVRKMQKFDRGETDSDIAMSERMPGILDDPDDAAQIRID